MMTNQLGTDVDSTAPSLLVAAHCLTIKRKTKRIDIQELTAMLDDLFRELYFKPVNPIAYLNSLNEIVHAFNTSFVPALVSVHSHYFFFLVRNAIQSLLQKSYSKSQLNQQEMTVLRNCIVLLENLVKKINDVSKIITWIADQTFIDALAQSLYHINKIPSANNNNKHLIRQVERLLSMFTNIQERLPWNLHQELFVPLLQPIINCLTSSTYEQLFQDLKHSSTSLSSIQKLYLIKCPHFLESYNGPNIEKTIDEVLEIMLPRYISILDIHTKTIKHWQRPMMRSIRYLLTSLIFAEGCFTSHLDNQSIQSLIDHLLCLIKESKLVNKIQTTPKTQETLLIDSALAVFSLLVYESDALDYIRKCKPFKIFQTLISTSYESIVLNAYMMLAYTMDENDINGSQIELSRLTVTILNLLHKSVESSKQMSSNEEPIKENINRSQIQLIEILKGLVKHEKVKKEILKQKAIAFLIEYSKKLDGLAKQFILECLWTLSFNEQAAQLIRTDSNFIEELKTIPRSVINKNQENNIRYSNSFSRRRNSTVIPSNDIANDGIHQMANGLLWNINKESKLRDKEQKSTKEIKTGNNRTFIYDIMMSFSYDDKDIVHKIYQYLDNEGFHIWCEHDNPHRQTMETQVEAIDNSAVVILCISNSYKQNNQCQSIAEYASKCKRVILPLIIREGNQIDGWLNSVNSGLTPIDFGTLDFKNACLKLTQEINQYVKKKAMDMKVKTITPINTEQFIQKTTPIFFDRQQQQKQQQAYEYVISRPTTPGSGSILIDRIQKTPIHITSRPTTPGMIPVVSIVSLTNSTDQIVLPEEFLRRDTQNANYRYVPITNWKRKDILDFFYDSNLHIMMPICEAMTGRALLRFFQMCQSKPSRLYSQINDELRTRFKSVALPMGVYTRFLIEIDNIFESISETIPVLSRPSSAQLQQIAYVPDKVQVQQPPPPPPPPPPPSSSQANFTPTGHSTTTLNQVQHFKPIQIQQEPEIHRNKQVIERTVFRPATAIDEPYNFFVESAEEPTAILKQVERYGPQLLFLDQKAREQRQMNGFH